MVSPKMPSHITRRRFLQVAAASSAALLAACAAPIATPAPAATTAPSGPGEPIIGGELRGLWSVAPSHFNPLTAVQPQQRQVHHAMLLALLDRFPDYTGYDGMLAESWDISADATEYTFKIWDDITWHDGTPVTAADVEYTFRMALTPATQSRFVNSLALIKGAPAFSAGETDAVEGIQVVDDKTIRFVTANPTGLFLEQMLLPILPKHILGDTAPADLVNHRYFYESPVGSGPFKFVRYEVDQYVELEANHDYFQGRPRLDRLIFRIIQAADTAQIAMERGEVDWDAYRGLPENPDILDSFIANPNFMVCVTKGEGFNGFAFNFRREHWHDPRVRQAWYHALDRERLIRTFAGGNGRIYDTPLPHTWIQNDTLPRYTYNPDMARQLLAEGGWDNDYEVVVNILSVTNENERARLAAMQQMMAEVGVKIRFEEMETAVWVAEFYDNKSYDAVLVQFGIFTDPDGFLKLHLVPSGRNASGYGEYKGQEWIDMVNRAGELVDREERRAIYLEIQKIMHDDPSHINLTMASRPHVINRRVYIPFLTEGQKASSAADVSAAELTAVGTPEYRPETWGVRS